jgi:protease IV
MTNPKDDNEAKLMREVLMAHIVEQRRARRWGIFFKVVIFLIALLFVLPLYTIGDSGISAARYKPHVAVIKIEGAIMPDEDASADNINAALKKAFKNELVAGVILKINSPGGSPVQSRQIYKRIKSFKEKYKKPVIAVIEDMGASAAYLIACGADEIYADEASRVGSIGVLVNGFGFNSAIDKLGIDRRLYTAGRYKGWLDPFSPRKIDQEKLLQIQLDEVHNQFINIVKEGRGDRLKNNPDLFTGLSWTGEQSLALGLIDGFADAREVSNMKFNDLELVNYTTGHSVLNKLLQNTSAHAIKSLANTLMLQYQ